MEWLSDGAQRLLRSEPIPGYRWMGFVAVLDAGPQGALTLDELRARVAERIVLAPRLRQRILQGDGGAAWVDDTAFTVDAHVHRLAAPAGADDPLAAAPLIAREAWSEPVDLAVAPWQMHLVDGFAGDRGALAVRFHHTIADGIGFLAMAAGLLFDLPPGTPVPADDWHPEPAPAPDELVGAARERPPRERPKAADRAPREPLHELPGVLRREVLHRVGASPLLHEDTRELDLAFARRRLAELKHLETALGTPGVTVNDVVLAGLALGAGRWLADSGVDRRSITVRVPVSFHGKTGGPVGEEAGGLMLVELPVHEEDPLAALRTVNAETRERKEHHDAETVGALKRLGYRLPGPLGRWLVHEVLNPHAFDLALSNVPGPDASFAIRDRPVAAGFPVRVPAAGHTMSVALASLSGTVSFCFAAHPTPELRPVAELAIAVDAGFDALEAVCP